MMIEYNEGKKKFTVQLWQNGKIMENQMKIKFTTEQRRHATGTIICCLWQQIIDTQEYDWMDKISYFRWTGYNERWEW